MFCDTHCHLSHISERSVSLNELFAELDTLSFRFILDIGTKPGDFLSRLALVKDSYNDTIPSYLHFSSGLWPSNETIENRHELIKVLENDIAHILSLAEKRNGFAALGECGLDRFWNGAEAVERNAGLTDADDGPGSVDLRGEEELFEMQLECARKNSLPIIVHSRDAFEPTVSILKNSNHEQGEIHCFSYGKEEARRFLDLGYYISFPGTITWTKREADFERIASLLRFIPRDRLLLETDAPYLTPTPHRGKTNTSAYIPLIYEQAAKMIGISVSEISEIVFANSVRLFKR